VQEVPWPLPRLGGRARLAPGVPSLAISPSSYVRLMRAHLARLDLPKPCPLESP